MLLLEKNPVGEYLTVEREAIPVKVICRMMLLVILLSSSGCSKEIAPNIPGRPSESGQNAQDLIDITALQLVNAYPELSFRQPVAFVHVEDDTNRIFVVEKAGRIYSFDNNAQSLSASLFLDISNRVDSSASEKGLLGLAFHPDFAQNGLFCVNYTSRTETIVARYQATNQTPQSGLPNSEQILMRIPQPFANHNGGHLAFGPDGFLYIATGDGGSAGDPHGNAQNRSSLLGKILRIDVDTTAPGLVYGIPADNPFVGNTSGYRPEIYAYGLRNPWKFSFDRDGRLWAADVGQNTIEEINLVQKGGNYGWNIMEGSLCYPASSNCSQDGLELPVWEYRHPLGRSITGGYVYYGNRLPGLNGAYIYGDYVTGRIWALRLISGQTPVNQEIVDSQLNTSALGIDQEGELYIVDLGGKIYKLERKSQS